MVLGLSWRAVQTFLAPEVDDLPCVISFHRSGLPPERAAKDDLGHRLFVPRLLIFGTGKVRGPDDSAHSFQHWVTVARCGDTGPSRPSVD